MGSIILHFLGFGFLCGLAVGFLCGMLFLAMWISEGWI